jgi:hypothetical protein
LYVQITHTLFGACDDFIFALVEKARGAILRVGGMRRAGVKQKADE